MKLRRATCVLLLCACSLACAIREERAGGEDFRGPEARALAWEPGQTTLLEVTRALGPPDTMLRSGDDTVFVYRFRHEVQRGLLIRFYLNLLTAARAERIDSTLVAAFDPDGLLLYHAIEDSDAETSDAGVSSG